jgi:hypothetical protein
VVARRAAPTTSSLCPALIFAPWRDDEDDHGAWVRGLSHTLTFLPGEMTKTITIEVKGDSKKEANETLYLDLFGNSGNSLFTNNRGLGTILNDD